MHTYILPLHLSLYPSPLLTEGEEYGGVGVCRNVPECNVNGHGAQQQAHAAGNSLCTGEGTAPGGVHNGHPDVFIPEARGGPVVENVPVTEENLALTQLQCPK